MSRTRSGQFAEKECIFKEMVHESVRDSIANKNTLGMEEFLHNIKHPDKFLMHRCRTGSRLVGESDPTSVFPEKPEEEIIEGANPGWLPRLAKANRKPLNKSLRKQPVDDILRDLYHTTTNESVCAAFRGPRLSFGWPRWVWIGPCCFQAKDGMVRLIQLQPGQFACTAFLGIRIPALC